MVRSGGDSPQVQVPIHLEGKTTTNEEEAEEDPQGSRQVKCKYKLDTLKTLCQEKLSNILDEKNCLMTDMSHSRDT